MPFRFQQRIKILPGISLNLSKKGISTSIGVKGAKVTFGHGQVRTTTGIPGTGLSSTNITKLTASERDTASFLNASIAMKQESVGSTNGKKTKNWALSALPYIAAVCFLYVLYFYVRWKIQQ